MGTIGEDEEYLGSSKFDKLRRVSIIKPVATRLGLKEGDEVSFYRLGDLIIVRRRETLDTSQDMLLKEILRNLKMSVKYAEGPSGEVHRILQVESGLDMEAVNKLDADHLNMLFKELFGEKENGMITHY